MNEPAAVKHPYFIGALAKGLEVLDAFSPARPELGLKDIAEAAGVTQPSALRIAYTLVTAGFLVRNPMTKGYRLGPKTVSIGLATMGAMTLPEICEPYMAALRDETDETIKLGVRVGGDVVVVARKTSRRHPPGFQYIGSSSPLTLGSLGRSILAWLPDEEIAALLDAPRLEVRTEKSLDREQVLAEVAASRKRGFAINDQGVTIENRSVGAPLIAPGAGPVGSINLSVSAQRITLDELVRKYGSLIARTAADISATLPPQVQGAGDSFSGPANMPD